MSEKMNRADEDLTPQSEFREEEAERDETERDETGRLDPERRSSLRQRGRADDQEFSTENKCTDIVASDGSKAFFSPNEADGFRARWESIQVGFVDDPRTSVQSAAQLIGDAMKRLSEEVATERRKFETSSRRENGKATEEMRLLLRRYRSFFKHLMEM
jgi:hypothetical protein